jgi:hypothetical protein
MVFAADAGLARVGRCGRNRSLSRGIEAKADDGNHHAREAGGFPSLKRLAAGEALIDAVPVADLLLAQLPAEENHFVPTERRKVEEAFLE